MAHLPGHARRPGVDRDARHDARLRVHARWQVVDRADSRQVLPLDVAAGTATVIPFTAKVEAGVAARLLFENTIDDGSTVRAKLVRWPAISPDGKRVVFSALSKLWIMS